MIFFNVTPSVSFISKNDNLDTVFPVVRNGHFLKVRLNSELLKKVCMKIRCQTWKFNTLTATINAAVFFFN